MNCRECKDHLQPYLDGELYLERMAVQRVALEGHLDGCPSCRYLFSTCQLTIQFYRRQPAPPLPSSLHRRLMEQIGRQPRPPIPPGANLNH